MDVGSAVGSADVVACLHVFREPYWGVHTTREGSDHQTDVGGTRGSKSLLRVSEVQAVLRNGQTLLRGGVENRNAYVKKILSTASMVLPSGSSFTWVCLLAQLRSCTWMINRLGVVQGSRTHGETPVCTNLVSLEYA